MVRYVDGKPAFIDTMAKKYTHCLMLRLDAREGLLAVDDWQRTTNITEIEFAQQMAIHPIAGIIFTNITKDGMLEGPNFEAQKQLRDSLDVPVMASGGFASFGDIPQLASLGRNGCASGRATYKGRLPLGQLLAADSTTGVPTS